MGKRPPWKSSRLPGLTCVPQEATSPVSPVHGHTCPGQVCPLLTWALAWQTESSPGPSSLVLTPSWTGGVDLNKGSGETHVLFKYVPPTHTHALLSIPQRQGGRAAAGTAQGPLAGEVDAHCLRECPCRGAENRGAPSLLRLASPTQHGQADRSGPLSLSDWKVHRSVFLPSAGLAQARAGSSPLRVLTT